MMTMYISPYRRLASLREAMDRILEESASEGGNEREMLLPVDVIASDDSYTVRALIPGLEAEDLNIEILNNTIAIRGEFNNSTDENNKYLTCELPSGRFSRVVALPVAVDASKAEASLKNGLLELHVPKAEAHRPKSDRSHVVL